VVFAEDDEQIAKLSERRSDLPHLDKVVTFDGATDGDWVIGLGDLEKLGEELLAKEPDVVEKRVDATGPDDLATLIYTSGTTGRPKGVRLRHTSWTYEGAAIEAQGILDENDLQFLWLPMAHSFGKVLLSTQLACGFATAIDGRVDKIIDNLAVVRPTFMGAAPRIFEKAYSRIVTMQAAEGGLKEKIFKQAFKVGLEKARLELDGKPVPRQLKVQHALFDRLVFSKIRERFGGRVRFFISGAAALNRDIAEWFGAAGIVILEGYGMTESSAGSFVNHPDDNRFGTVGAVLPGTEVRIAEDGEVLIKGPGVMAGYHNQPEQTAEALTEDGWLHTGDIGELDADGYLRITDRKKDLFKTSGGKYIAPSSIESSFKAICPYASQVVVHGAERNFCVALVTLDPDAVNDWAAENGMSGKPYAEVVASPAVEKMVGEYVETLNSRLNRWETIKKFVILDHDLTVESGELTPSMKVKRKVVEENYRDDIETMYS
jgi:long-chain acyl-CoA synthetase